MLKSLLEYDCHVHVVPDFQFTVTNKVTANISSHVGHYVEIIELPAFAICEVKVRCRSVDAFGLLVGYWSEAASVYITTPQASETS